MSHDPLEGQDRPWTDRVAASSAVERIVKNNKPGNLVTGQNCRHKYVPAERLSAGVRSEGLRRGCLTGPLASGRRRRKENHAAGIFAGPQGLPRT